MSALYDKTLSLLRECEHPISEISRRTGLPVSWLKKMKYQVIADPSVRRVEKLYEHLSGSKLEVQNDQ